MTKKYRLQKKYIQKLSALSWNRRSVQSKQTFYLGQTEPSFRVNRRSVWKTSCWLDTIKRSFHIKRPLNLTQTTARFAPKERSFIINRNFIWASIKFPPMVKPELYSQSLNSKLSCSQTPCCSSASSFGLETESPIKRIGWTTWSLGAAQFWV